MSNAGAPHSELVAAGLVSLRAGNAAQALEYLQGARRLGASDPQVLLATAHAAHAVGQAALGLDAIETFLIAHPSHVQGLLKKGDLLVADDRPGLAAAAYRRALSLVPSGAAIPSKLQAQLTRAQAYLEKVTVDFEERLHAQLAEHAVPLGPPGSRSRQALDILFGRAEAPQTQSPNAHRPEKFFFPGLPEQTFWDPKALHWTTEFIAHGAELIAEFESASLERSFEAYVPKNAKQGHVSDARVAGNTDWGALHLFKDGVRQSIADAFPQTMAALGHTPQPHVAGKSPLALFSRLSPGMHIPPHHGVMNTRLVCHWPVVAPEGCTLRVGADTQSWRMGSLMVFDDSIEHEARNATASDRIVLLFDVWRPELTPDERRFVSLLSDVIDDISP